MFGLSEMDGLIERKLERMIMEKVIIRSFFAAREVNASIFMY